MGGDNEFVECFCWGAVAEGGFGAVVELVGDGVEVGLVAGDGGSFGQVAADEPVGVFVGSSLSHGLWECAKNTSTPVSWVRRWWRAISRPWSQVSVRIAPSRRPWMRRVSAPGLVGFPTQGQGHNDQVAGGALDQSRCSRWLRHDQ